MDNEEHERLADSLEQQADDLQTESERLGHEIDDAKQDWESKRADPATPGALEPFGEADPADADADPETPRPADAEQG